MKKNTYIMLTIIGGLLAFGSSATLMAKKKHRKDCCPSDNAFATRVSKEDSCRVIESCFGVDPCSSISLRGKNVLIIGGSRGIGRATAQAFAAEGANVIATSRHPECYFQPQPECIGTQNGIPPSPGLSPFPLELASESSIAEFFQNAIEPIWDHIDILYLGALKIPVGVSLATAQASDLFEFWNVQLVGLQRVVSHAFQYMANVDDSRMIIMSSIASVVPLPWLGGYSTAKAALVQYVKQWNMERLIYEEACGKPFYKTVAISFEGSWIASDIDNTLPITFPGGVCCPWDIQNNPKALGITGNIGNAIAEGMPVERAAQAILWMSTTEDPEWRYAVFGKDEEYCVLPKCKPLKPIDFWSKFNAYKSKKAFTDWIKARPWTTIAKNPFDSTWQDCVEPTDQFPPLPAPPILKDMCCVEEGKQTQRHTRPEFVEDLVNNRCKTLPFDNDFTTPPPVVGSCPLP